MPRGKKAWEVRFWPKVKKQENGCWFWMGSRKDFGHGMFQLNHQTKLAHRFIWEQLRGEIPKGLCVCHTCNNAACVFVGHMVLGTHDFNMQHRHASGRWRVNHNGVFRHRPKVPTMEERFWSKVEKTPNCWLWRGFVGPQGYGAFNLGVGRGSKIVRAHRVAWELENKTSIPIGMDILHSCDNPTCVFPQHLRVGDQLENTLECEAKGRARHPRGEEHGCNKLTEQQVMEIRSDYRVELLGYLADKFGVTRQAISAIVKRKVWKHI